MCVPAQRVNQTPTPQPLGRIKRMKLGGFTHLKPLGYDFMGIWGRQRCSNFFPGRPPIGEKTASSLLLDGVSMVPRKNGPGGNQFTSHFWEKVQEELDLKFQKPPITQV